MDDNDNIKVISVEVVTDDSANSASDPLPLPESSPPLDPDDSVELPPEAGSQSLIGGNAHFKFPKALASVGGNVMLTAIGYDKDASALSPFLTTCVSLDISKEFVLLKAVEKAELSGCEFSSVLLRGHKWFPSALFSIPCGKRESRLHWLEKTYRAGGSASDSEEPKHDFWYPGFSHNLLKNQELFNKGEIKSIKYIGFKQAMEDTLNAIPLMSDKNDPNELGTLMRDSWSKLKSVPVPDKSCKRKRTAKPGSSLSKRVKGQLVSTTAKTPQAPAKESTTAVVDVEGEAAGEGPKAQSSQVQPVVPTPDAPSPNGDKIPPPPLLLSSTPPPT